MLTAVARMLLWPFARICIPDARIDPRKDAGVIIAANHRSLLDIFVGLVAFRRWRVRPGVLIRGDYFDHRLLGPVLRAIGGIPAGRGYGAQAMTSAREVLRAGGVLVLAPEGRITHGGERTDGIADLKPGVGRLSAELGSPILLVGLSNSDRVWPLGARLPRLPRPFCQRPTVRLRTEWLVMPEGSDPAEILVSVSRGLSQLLQER
ncbi:lysophospholipid acyltransferase family protein [Actinomadura gamaensis]|uniref:Lysophospholipid acyltransferase family protein n=1 Tax=Actinomadura gamaensis TaxID=1763541 RepID=A0ABV9TTZ4_9ACTN